MIRNFRKVGLFVLSAGVLVAAHADEPLKVDTGLLD
jgi:hypothetical protein